MLRKTSGSPDYEMWLRLPMDDYERIAKMLFPEGQVAEVSVIDMKITPRDVELHVSFFGYHRKTGHANARRTNATFNVSDLKWLEELLPSMDGIPKYGVSFLWPKARTKSP